MSEIAKRKEGYVKVPGGKVWYEIVGEDKKVPLITIHGGPGSPHNYLQPIEDLSDEREVIFYDQLGCGKSEKPNDVSLWTIERFVAELQSIINYLDLKQYHLLGHSWGATIAVSFALTKPNGLKSLVLSDPYISTPKWEEDAERLLRLLPEDMQKVIKDGVEKSEEFKRASKEFHKRFVRNLDPIPEAFKKTNKGFNYEIYKYMWGPEEYLVNGTLKNFDPSNRLREITTTVLLLCGRYDEATPEAMQYFKNLFPIAEIRIFEESGHHPFWNEREAYIKTVRNFLEGLG